MRRVKVYGDAEKLTWHLTSGSLAGKDKVDGELTRDAGEMVGKYHIGQGTLTLNNNYELSFEGSVLEILPKPVTVTAIPGRKLYSMYDPELHYEIISGSLVGQDTFAGTIIRVEYWGKLIHD